MLVSMLSCGQGNYLFPEVCWEAGCMYGDGALPCRPKDRPKTPQHYSRVLQRWGCHCSHFSEAPLKTPWVYCRVNRVCTIRELTLEVQMFAHANYLTADHTRTRISQITTIWCKNFIFCLKEEFDFPGSYKWQELVRNASNIIKLSWMTSVISKQK